MQHRRSKPPGERASSPDAAPDAGARYKVLVVDDDLLFRKMTEAVLSERFDVVGCSSAEHALSLLSSTRFDVICSDFAMPGMSGVELLRRVEALPYFVSTILITGSEQYIRGPQASSQRYVLLKPFEPERLIGLVQQLGQLAQMKRSVQALRDSVAPTSDAEPPSVRSPSSIPPSVPYSRSSSVPPPPSRTSSVPPSSRTSSVPPSRILTNPPSSSKRGQDQDAVSKTVRWRKQ